MEYRRIFVRLMAKLQHGGSVSYSEVLDAKADAVCIAMTIGQADVTLTHAGPQHPHMDLEFNFGPMPLRNRDAALQLLELNAELAWGSQGGFGIDSAADTVIYRCRQALQSVGAAQLQATLMESGELAAAWFDQWHGRKAVRSMPAQAQVSQ
jgi:hypothetical protein